MDQMDQELEELILEETNSPFTVPTLEEVLRLADDGTALADHLGMSLRQMGMHKELLRRLGNLAFRAMKDMKHCYIGGSYSRRTALKYHFDVDLVLFIRGFNHNKNKVYQTQLYDGLERLLYHALQLKGASLQSMTLCSDFAEFNLLITGEAAPEKLPSIMRGNSMLRLIQGQLMKRCFLLLQGIQNFDHLSFLSNTGSIWGVKRLTFPHITWNFYAWRSSVNMILIAWEIFFGGFWREWPTLTTGYVWRTWIASKTSSRWVMSRWRFWLCMRKRPCVSTSGNIRQRSNAVCVSCHRPSTSVAASRYRPL